MEHVALQHVLGNDLVKSSVLILHETLDQLTQLRVLLLKAREFQLGGLFNLSELFKRLWIAGVCRASLLFKDIERLHEVIICLISDLLTIIADAELIRPRSDL